MASSVPIVSLLIVDDSPTDLFLVEAVLEQLGISLHVDIARDGVEALERLALGPVPDLVLMDMNMPRLTGLEVLQALGEKLVGLRVVVWSSGWEAKDVALMLAAGASAYLLKPSSYNDLVKLLDTLLHTAA